MTDKCSVCKLQNCWELKVVLLWMYGTAAMLLRGHGCHSLISGVDLYYKSATAITRRDFKGINKLELDETLD